MFINYLNTAKNSWREEAIAMLKNNTNAPLSVIKHFVDNNWLDLEDDEENLHHFEYYLEAYNNVGVAN